MIDRKLGQLSRADRVMASPVLIRALRETTVRLGELASELVAHRGHLVLSAAAGPLRSLLAQLPEGTSFSCYGAWIDMALPRAAPVRYYEADGLPLLSMPSRLRPNPTVDGLLRHRVSEVLPIGLAPLRHIDPLVVSAAITDRGHEPLLELELDVRWRAVRIASMPPRADP